MLQFSRTVLAISRCSISFLVQAAGPNINRVIALCGPTGYVPTAKWLPAGRLAGGASDILFAAPCGLTTPRPRHAYCVHATHAWVPRSILLMGTIRSMLDNKRPPMVAIMPDVAGVERHVVSAQAIPRTSSRAFPCRQTSSSPSSATCAATTCTTRCWIAVPCLKCRAPGKRPQRLHMYEQGSQSIRFKFEDTDFSGESDVVPSLQCAAGGALPKPGAQKHRSGSAGER